MCGCGGVCFKEGGFQAVCGMLNSESGGVRGYFCLFSLHFIYIYIYVYAMQRRHFVRIFSDEKPNQTNVKNNDVAGREKEPKCVSWREEKKISKSLVANQVLRLTHPLTHLHTKGLFFNLVEISIYISTLFDGHS